MSRHLGLILMSLAVGMGACTALKRSFDRSFGERLGATRSFLRALDELDSVCQRTEVQKEPDSLVYAEQPERMPWFVRQLEGTGIDFLLEQSMTLKASKVTEANPSGYARDRVLSLIRMVQGEPWRAAQVGLRLLWILEADENTLNQVTALAGIARIMDDLAIDPTRPALLVIDDSSERRSQVETTEVEMEKYWPGYRKQPLTAAGRRAFTKLVNTYVASALPRGRQQRLAVLAFANAVTAEADPQMREVLHGAMLRTLSFATAIGLRDALRSRSPDVRDLAIRVYRGRSGAGGLAFVLRQIAAPPGVSSIDPYDPDPTVRLTLVRLCAQFRLEEATVSVQGGKMPVDYLYDVAVADSDPGLRRVALEGLARCLQRPKIVFEDEWAKTWRQEFIVERKDR